MFGADFTTWMAWIGGYPTIFTTVGTVLLLMYAGSRAIYRHKDFTDVKYHINEALAYEDKIKVLLSSTKPLTRWRFKRLIGEHAYMEITYVEQPSERKTFKQKLMERKVQRLIKKLNKNRR